MSWLGCDACGRLLNSDDDPDCFEEYVDGGEAVVCEVCREGHGLLTEMKTQGEAK